MMFTRQTGNQRLSSLNINLNSNDYLIYKFLFRDLQYAITKYAYGKVLDVGCGNKPYKKLFPNDVVYTGCDIAQSSLFVVDVICPATELKFEDNSFDTVFSTQVLEHVEDHRKAISEAVRVLKPGGKYIFSVPFTWELHEEPYDFFRFTKYGLEYLLNIYGLKKIEIISNGGKWATVGQIRINILWSFLRKRKKIGKFYRLLIKYSGIKILLNSYYFLLDRLDKDDLLSLNYVVIGEKGE